MSAVVAILCLLALDDITTGVQPHFIPEWIMVGITVIWFGGCTIASLRRSRR